MSTKSNTPIKRVLLYASLIPLSWMLIGTTCLVLALVFSFVFKLPSSTSNSFFFFGQYSHSFYAAYKTGPSGTVYLFPFVKFAWLFGVLGWLLLSFGFSFLMRNQRPIRAIVAAPIITLGFMLLARYLILTFGFQIPLEGF